MPKENRKAARAKHDSILEIYDEAGPLTVKIGRLLNVSTRGASFSSTALLAVGQKIHVRLRLLKEGPLDIESRIVWAKQKSNATIYGIEFESVKPEGT